MNILMTGAGKSLGSYIYEGLLDNGHHVFGVGLDGPQMTYDLTCCEDLDAGDASMIFAAAENEFDGEVEVLINNAGMTHMAWFEDHSFQALDRVTRLNYYTPFILSREMVRRCAARYRPGVGDYSNRALCDYYRIINTCSMSTFMGLRTSPAYACSKAALTMLTRNMAKEFAGRWPFIVVGISPGGIEGTTMHEQALESMVRDRGMTEEQARKYFNQSPLGRSCTKSEVFELFCFAVESLPMQCTGTILTMPGGMGY